MVEAPGRDLGAGCALSAARVVGRLDPPPGRTWQDVLSSSAAERDCLLEFHVRSARLLGVAAGRIHLQKKAGSTDLERARAAPGRWHRDSFIGPGHIVCLIGDTPTEFLLGEYDQRDLEDPERWPRLEASMAPWQPREAELVHIDRFTVHRRPRLVDGRRLFLLATVDSSVFTSLRARA